MTVDVDIYDEESQKVEIPAMPGDSPIKVIIYPCLSDCWQVETMRMKRKDYDGILRMPESHTVRVAERLKLIKVLRFFRFFRSARASCTTSVRPSRAKNLDPMYTGIYAS